MLDSRDISIMIIVEKVSKDPFLSAPPEAVFPLFRYDICRPFWNDSPMPDATLVDEPPRRFPRQPSQIVGIGGSQI
jgi:hypothetical protein